MKKSAKTNKAVKKKNFFEKIFSGIKSIRVEDIIFILLLITGILVVLGLIAKRDILSVYFARIMPSPIYYFDFIIRNGILKYVYFALIIAVVYWLAKKVIKKKLSLVTGLVVIVIGLIIAYLIYLLPPHFIHEREPLPGSFWPYPEEEDINTTNQDRCGDRLDFIFSPSSQLGLKVLPEIQLAKEQGLPINIYCTGDTWINDDIVCRERYNLDPKEGEKLREELGLGRGGFSREGVPASPVLVIGCKYFITARQDANVTREFICDYTEIC